MKFEGKQQLKPLKETETLTIIAAISHRTWMKQRSRDKQIAIETLPKEINKKDMARAMDAWDELMTRKPITRKEAVMIVAQSSHKIWLADQESQADKKLASGPTPHDFERAEDIIHALETNNVLRFDWEKIS